tara:strand:+ start:185 stop:499 length:315 start_codon:yes stop_codon:yes gene_type:complete
MQYRIAIMLVALMTWTGYVWAAHVDLSTAGDTDVYLSATDHQYADNNQRIDDCADHCCHAAQHFGGLLPASAADYQPEMGSWMPQSIHGLAKHRHEPLFKPPKA